jgi:cell division protein FtsW (lipid II flippase)
VSDATTTSNIALGVQQLPESHTDFVLSLVVSDPLLLVGIVLLGVAAIAGFVLLLRRRSSRSKRP